MEIISTYGLITGFLSFVALTCAIIGMIYSRAASNVIAPVYEVSENLVGLKIKYLKI
jgi:hypothetical protein